MHKKDTRVVLGLMVFVHLIIFLGCTRFGKVPNEKYRETQILMGTMVHLDVCRTKNNTHKIDSAYRDIWQRLEDISWRMNVFDERSDVSKINNSNLKPVFIGSDTYHVLESSLYFSKATKGAFDVTVRPLIELWKRSAKNNSYPDFDQIQKVQSAVGSDHIQLLADNYVKKLNDQTSIDLGGIAKGYAVDEAVRIFRKHGVQSFFIDLGGDIYVGGYNCLGEPWRIGINDPRDQSKLIDVISLIDGAVATSGNYEQYFTIGNQRWSHIVNPSTGYPQKDVISATVIAPSAMEADALATALCVLGSSSGTDHINSMTDRHASLIVTKTDSNQLQRFVSREYKKFQIPKE